MSEPEVATQKTGRPPRGLAPFLAAGCGAGWIPVAPGTFGSLLGIPLALGLARIPTTGYAVLGLVLAVCLGVAICAAALRQTAGQHDPKWVVIDEVLGMAVALFPAAGNSVLTVVIGFLLFRLFDVTKPPPIRQLERLPGAYGVVADDLMAGVLANLSLRAFLWLVSAT